MIQLRGSSLASMELPILISRVRVFVSCADDMRTRGYREGKATIRVSISLLRVRKLLQPVKDLQRLRSLVFIEPHGFQSLVRGCQS